MKSLLKITLQDRNEVFLFSECSSGKCLKLNILDLHQNESFRGQVNETFLRSQAASIGMTFNNFFAKATTALFQPKLNDIRYLYNLKNNDESYTFEWKSIDSEETVIKLGYVHLEKKSFTLACSDILTYLSDELVSSNETNAKLKSSLEKSEMKNAEITEMFSVATEAKQNLEKELFSKFIVVLNAKKRKIRELSSQDSDSSSYSKKVSKKKKKNNAPIVFSDSSNDVDNFDKPGPSSNSKNCMFMDDIEQNIPITPCKMRNRKAASGKVSKNIDFKSQSVDPPRETVENESDDDDLFKHF